MYGTLARATYQMLEIVHDEKSPILQVPGSLTYGCVMGGLVMLALMVLVVATTIGGIADQAGWAFGEQLMSVWPFLVLAALGVFLALQVLPLLMQGPSD